MGFLVEKLDFHRNNFDLIRLLAALQVAVIHAYEHLGVRGFDGLIELLSIFPGVPIFFVISGFLISASWERRQSLSSYVRNRVLRIYPALWVCLGFSLLCVTSAVPLDASLGDLAVWLSAQATIAQFYNPEFFRDYGVGVLNGSLWTIPIELQFYLALPLLYLLFERLNWRNTTLLVCLAALLAINQFSMGLDTRSGGLLLKLYGVTLLPYLYIFVLGVLLQRNRWFVRRYLAGRAMTWLLVYLLAVVVCAALGLPVKGNALHPLLVLLVALLVISFAYSYQPSLAGILGGTDISYGVYIYHMVFINWMLSKGNSSALSSFAMVMICSVVAALASWHYVEKPALKRKSATLRA